MVGVRRLTNEGNVCQTSAPMARQMADDLTKVVQMSEAVTKWYSQRRNDEAFFTPGCWERARFLELPLEELRGAMLAYRLPSEAEEQSGEPDGSLIELAEHFVCAETEGTRCATKDLRVTAKL